MHLTAQRCVKNTKQTELCAVLQLKPIVIVKKFQRPAQTGYVLLMERRTLMTLIYGRRNHTNKTINAKTCQRLQLKKQNKSKQNAKNQKIKTEKKKLFQKTKENYKNRNKMKKEKKKKP